MILRRGGIRARLPLAAAFALTLTGCSARDPGIDSTAFATDHPLVGRTYRVADGAYLDDAALAAELAGAEIVLLGEHHPNPDHHRAQAEILAALRDLGRRPGVVFEMIDVGQQPDVDTCIGSPSCTPETLATQIGWDAHGWPDWHIYEPVLRIALDEGWRIVAGSYERSRIHQIVANGIHTLDPDTRSRLGVGRPLGVATHAAMVEEIRVSHCGHPDERRIEPMITAQRLRDSIMASAIELARIDSSVVLIAGNGHVRTDWGVPVHVAQRLPDARLLSMAMLEVRPGLDDPSAYAQALAASALPFDVVRFTARVTERDSCDVIAEQLEQIKEMNREREEASR